MEAKTTVNNDKIPVFRLERVCYSYPHEEAVLKDISLTIYPGERVSILGANGSGKSTLLKILCGLILPSEGIFEAFGSRLEGRQFNSSSYMKEYHRKTGFVFQNSDAQLFCSTVQDEIAFGPLQLNLPDSEVRERVEDMLALLEIKHLRNKAPFKLSGGEKKKVALASVLVLNPQVLVLDEPTNGLDPRTSRWLAGFLNQLANAGKTIITSTHNLGLVQEISDRAVVFAENHTVAADEFTEKVLADVELLKRVNLVDEFYHFHGDEKHAHFHIHNF